MTTVANPLSGLSIEFDPGSQLVLNLLLAVMMFGVALRLRPSDFRRVVQAPRAPVTGLLAQFLLLPALTGALTLLVPMQPGIALGMILVASCPGGSFSNILTWLSRGSVATSVSMTATSSLAAMLMTPLNFTFWGSVNPATREILASIAVGPGQILTLIVLVLAVPLVLGMWAGSRFRWCRRHLEPVLKRLSLLLFLLFVTVALLNNGALFLSYFSYFAGFVILHNAFALLLGAGLGQALRLAGPDRRAVTLEVGIQNSGLGLILLFNFFPDQGAMMVITAFWGVWHLISGLLLTFWWRLRDRRSGHTPGIAL